MKRLSDRELVLWLFIIVGVFIIFGGACSGGGNPMFEGFHGKVDGTDLGSAPVLALFHMDGCPHCVKFMPTWEKFKQQHGDKVKTVELEAKKDEGVVSKHNVKGFPTIKYYPDGMSGKSKELEGDRTEDNLKKLVGLENFTEHNHNEEHDEEEHKEHFVQGYSNEDFASVDEAFNPESEEELNYRAQASIDDPGAAAMP